MSDQTNNNGSGPAEGNGPSSSAQRIGRIGQWGGSSSAPSNSSRSGGGPRFATLSDLNSSDNRSASSRHGKDSDSGDNESETWFTGGEKSGLAVQNPNNRGDGPDTPGAQLVRNLLKKTANAALSTSATAGAASRTAFSGAGNTLGSDEVESQFVPDPTASSEQPSTGERATRHVTFWRNGFSIEDGPLLDYNDPANAGTLRAFDQGQAPAELLNVHYGQNVELRVTRRMHENYIPPQSRSVQVFEGVGHRLGAPVPSFTAEGSGSASSASPATAPVPAGLRNEPESMQTKFEVDETQPTTSVTIRLVDGTRMNLSHTIRDIRNFINASRPENLTRSYTIWKTFPNRVLGDDSQTIEAAKLQKSLVVQRLDE